MNMALWIGQGLLALIFIIAGATKLLMSKEAYEAQQPWSKDFAPAIIKTIGVLEVLGGIGVIAPMVTNILPQLTPWAAVGLVLTMLGAMATHARRQEYRLMGANVVLLSLRTLRSGQMGPERFLRD